MQGGKRRRTSFPLNPTRGFGLRSLKDISNWLESLPSVSSYLSFILRSLSFLQLNVVFEQAIFHKTSSTGRGVPAVCSSPSFPFTFKIYLSDDAHIISISVQTFLRRWPSLPRVVIFLSTRVVGLAHVEEEDRYRERVSPRRHATLNLYCSHLLPSSIPSSSHQQSPKPRR